MEVYVAANNPAQLKKAKDWVTPRETRDCLAPLDEWVQSAEWKWGPCRVFIEVMLPRGPTGGSYGRQVDLLICFSDRVALCEVKMSPPSALRDDTSVTSVVGQLVAQNDHLGRVLQANGFQSACVFPFLFLPKFEQGEHFAAIQKVLDGHSAPHIWPAGARPHPRNYFLPKVVAQRLPELETRLQRQPLPTGSSGLQDILNKELNQEFGGHHKLLRFNSFQDAWEYLRQMPRRVVVYDPLHDRQARADEVQKGRQALTDKGYIEIVGAPEIGKSAFCTQLIEEVLNSDASEEYEYQTLTIQACPDRDAVARYIYEVFQGDATNKTTLEILDELAGDRQVFWIQEYDTASRPGVQQLLTWVRSHYKDKSGTDEDPRARWIFESPVSLLSGGECLELGPLEKNIVARILEPLRPARDGRDPEAVMNSAQGNPGVARRLWLSDSDRDVSEQADLLKWLRHQLAREEWDLLPAVCVALSKSPLGVSLKSLIRCVSWDRRDLLTSQIQGSLASLLEKLKRWQKLQIVRLQGTAFDGLLQDILVS